MTAPTATPVFPRLPLLAVGAVLAVAIGAAAIGPAAVGGRSDPPPSRPVAERSLTFQDRADGAVVAREGAAEVAVFQGEQGFLRGTLRGMARVRRGYDVSSDVPFTLTAWADGRLTLDDPATRQRIDLEAFGPTNAAVFARLLPGLAGGAAR
jgi:putative photosynthetic complex assembly protein